MDLKLFASVFALIFLAELPDKTALAAVVLASRGRPLAVFFGAALAFTLQSLIAVCLGSVLGRLPAAWVRIGSGLLFLGFAVSLWFSGNSSEENPQPGADGGRGFLKAAWAAFLVIFAAELGDFTQIATAALTAKHRQPLTIFFAATLALCSVAAIAVNLGHRARHWIRPQKLQRAAAAAFAVIGILLLLH